MDRTGMKGNPDFDKEFKLRYFEPVKGAPEDTKMPMRSTMNAAGYDFFAPYECVVPSMGYSPKISFNIKAHMLHNEFLQLRIRSGMGINKGLIMLGSGVVDADYADNPDNDGNIATRFYNPTMEDYVIKKGDRICQGIFLKYYRTNDDAGCDIHRGGGYGSTGR